MRSLGFGKINLEHSLERALTRISLSSSPRRAFVKSADTLFQIYRRRKLVPVIQVWRLEMSDLRSETNRNILGSISHRNVSLLCQIVDYLVGKIVGTRKNNEEERCMYEGRLTSLVNFYEMESQSIW